MLAAYVLVSAALARPSGAPYKASWEQVRATLSQAICAEISDTRRVTLITNDRRRCGAKEDSRLTRAVDAVLEDAGIEIVPLAIDPLYTIDGAATAGGVGRRARDYYLSSVEYLRPVRQRLRPTLEEAGINCSDCPLPDSTPPRDVSWNEFVPYLTAHVWPDPVVTPRGPDGKPTGEPRYTYHICTGINGVTRMNNPDHLLVRAGFLAAMESASLKERSRTLFRGVLDEVERIRLKTDEAQTEYLRRRMGQALAGDPLVKRAACETLHRLSDVLGLVVAGCEEPNANATTQPPTDPTR